MKYLTLLLALIAQPCFSQLNTKKESTISLALKAGINNASVSVTGRDGSTSNNVNFKKKLTLRLGLEVEFRHPLRKHWALFLAPSIHRYSEEEIISFANAGGGGTFDTFIDYQSVELPMGLRYYRSISDKLEVFADFSLVYDFATGSKLAYYSLSGTEAESQTVTNNLNTSLGGGIKNRDALSLEFKFFQARDLFSESERLKALYKNFAVIIGYKIL